MQSTNQRNAFYLVSAFLGGLILLFVIAPLVGLFVHAGLGNTYDAMQEKEVTDSFLLTLITAFIATFVSSLGAIPLAYLLARRKFPLKGVVTGIIDLPLVIPHSAAGIAILGFIARDSAMGKAASVVGLSFVGSPVAICIAMAFVSLPILINAARDGFLAVPIRLEQAAMNLGASPFRVFLSISLPLAWRSVVSGYIMMFARGMSEFGAVVIVAYHPMIAPVLIFERFSSYGLKYATPVAALFILVSLVVFILFRLVVKKEKDA
jgi:molybdate/tungstate transport system permease protein